MDGCFESEVFFFFTFEHTFVLASERLSEMIMSMSDFDREEHLVGQVMSS